MAKKLISLVMAVCFISQQVGIASAALPAAPIQPQNAAMATGADAVVMRSLSYDRARDDFRVYLDKRFSQVNAADAETAGLAMFSYFRIGLALPNEVFWVNLRPEEGSAMLDPRLENTDLGRILLAADVQLKKDLASMTAPDTKTGREYWNKLYVRAEEIYGRGDVSIPTMTRPWIVPGEVILCQSGDGAHIYKATLKVMLEEDYLGGSERTDFKDQRSRELNEYSTSLIRSMIIPALNKEINSAARYAGLRQVYHSLIFAQWFKRHLRQGSSFIDSGNLSGLYSKEQWSKEGYYREYADSFRRGEYDREERVISAGTGKTRRYFSGGAQLSGIMSGAASAVNGVVPAGDKVVFSGRSLPVSGQVLNFDGNGRMDGAPDKFERDGGLSTASPEIVNKLQTEKAMERFADAFGKAPSEVDSYMARIAFDMDDKKDPNRLGWTVSMVKWLFDHQEKVDSLIADGKFISSNYKYVIFCGMGGSGLSVQVVKDVFGGDNIYSLGTTDPAAIANILDDISGKEGSLEAALAKTLVIPISKSGTTQETVSHKKYFEELFAESGIPVKEHMWVITDKGSPMDNGVYTQREIQLNGRGDIGGRFTAPTTLIFLLPLAIVAPEQVWPVLKQTLSDHQPAEGRSDYYEFLAGELFYLAKEEGRDKFTVILPEEMGSLALWLEQLFEESLGKDGKGITIFSGERLNRENILPADMNDRVFFRVNVGGRQTQPELWDHLARGGYPVYEVDIDSRSGIGSVMLGMQKAVAGVGYLWDICFVNQPGVEGYKKNTKAQMAGIEPGQQVQLPKWEYSRFGSLRVFYDTLIKAGILTDQEIMDEVLAMGAHISDASAVYAAILNKLCARDGFEAAELTSYGVMTPGIRQALERAREEICTNMLQLPCKLGEGPPRNHSYHQNIEQGRDFFFSSYFTALTLNQPGAKKFDGNLLRAQTFGTAQALIDANRKVVLIAADGTAEKAEKDLADFFDSVAGHLRKGRVGVSASRDGGYLDLLLYERLKVKTIKALNKTLIPEMYISALVNEIDGMPMHRRKAVMELTFKTANIITQLGDGVAVGKRLDILRAVCFGIDGNVKLKKSEELAHFMAMAAIVLKNYNSTAGGRDVAWADKAADMLLALDRIAVKGYVVDEFIATGIALRKVGVDPRAGNDVLAGILEMGARGESFEFFAKHSEFAEVVYALGQSERVLDFTQDWILLEAGFACKRAGDKLKVEPAVMKAVLERMAYLAKKVTGTRMMLLGLRQEAAMEGFLGNFGGRGADEVDSMDVYGLLSKASADAKRRDGGMESGAPEKTGGIDLRAVPMEVKPLADYLNSFSRGDSASVNEPKTELNGIKRLLGMGIVPSCQRVKELFLSCHFKGVLVDRTPELLACIGDILRLEERQAAETPQEIKQLLAYLSNI